MDLYPDSSLAQQWQGPPSTAREMSLALLSAHRLIQRTGENILSLTTPRGAEVCASVVILSLKEFNVGAFPRLHLSHAVLYGQQKCCVLYYPCYVWSMDDCLESYRVEERSGVECGVNLGGQERVQVQLEGSGSRTKWKDLPRDPLSSV